MRKISLLLLSFCLIITGFAQKNGSVRGLAFDSTIQQAVASATVTVLEKKDSSLVSFTITDNAGKFELKGIPNGEYRILLPMSIIITTILSLQLLIATRIPTSVTL